MNRIRKQYVKNILNALRAAGGPVESTVLRDAHPPKKRVDFSNALMGTLVPGGYVKRSEAPATDGSTDKRIFYTFLTDTPERGAFTRIYRQMRAEAAARRVGTGRKVRTSRKKKRVVSKPVAPVAREQAGVYVRIVDDGGASVTLPIEQFRVIASKLGK